MTDGRTAIAERLSTCDLEDLQSALVGIHRKELVNLILEQKKQLDAAGESAEDAEISIEALEYEVEGIKDSDWRVDVAAGGSVIINFGDCECPHHVVAEIRSALIPKWLG